MLDPQPENEELWRERSRLAIRILSIIISLLAKSVCLTKINEIKTLKIMKVKSLYYFIDGLLYNIFSFKFI